MYNAVCPVQLVKKEIIKFKNKIAEIKCVFFWFVLLQGCAFFSPWPMRQANSVRTIFGFTSTKSSGRAYTRAPILRANEMAYLGAKPEERGVRTGETKTRGL